MTDIWLLFSLLLDTLPFTYLQYSFLKHDLRYKPGKLALTCWFAITAAIGVICFAFTAFTSYNEDLFRLLRLVNCYVLLAVLLLSTKAARPKVVLSFSITTSFSLCFSTLAIYIARLTKIDAPPYMISTLVRTGIILLCYPFMVYFCHRLCAVSERITDRVVWTYLWPLPASIAVSELVFVGNSYNQSNITLLVTLGRVILCCGTIAVCWLLVFLTNRFEMRIHLQDANERNEALLALQRQQYARLAAKIEQTRAFRHDTRHHLNAMSSLSKNKEYEKLDAYISELAGTIADDRHITICENYAANAIMDSYIRKAQELGIPIKINFRLSNLSGISDGDLCVLLGNCVENAIDAAKEAEGTNRFITINAQEESDRIYMTFDNGFSGEIRSADGALLSSKRGFAAPGIGLSSIKAVVAKYNGDIKIETEDSIFRLSILLMKP